MHSKQICCNSIHPFPGYHRTWAAFILGVFFFWPDQSYGAVRVGTIFSNNMVIQREIKVPIWGSADPGEKVKVSMFDETQNAEADKDGRWKVWFTPRHATNQPFNITIAGTNSIEIKNVLIGDVWFCGGQSNMANPVRGSVNAAAEIAAADYPEIRDYIAYSQVDLTPQTDDKGAWRVCSPKIAGYFSAVAYFFARDIHQKYKVPIGIVENSLGATSIEAWMDHDALSSRPEIQGWIKNWDQSLSNLPTEKAKYLENIEAWSSAHPTEKAQFDAALKQWIPQVAEANAKIQPPPRMPQPPAGMPINLSVALSHYYQAGFDPVKKDYFFKMHPAVATGCFNGMTFPYIPYAIRGFLWFQGENNVGTADIYRFQFAALINSWRQKWGQGDIPFLFVQLANIGQPQVEPVETQATSRMWRNQSGIREAQMLVSLGVPNTAMATAIDIGDPVNVHFPNKQDVGHRLALAARALSYGEKIEYQGPIFIGMKKEGSKIRLKFSHVDGGLVAKGDKLSGFAISGENRKFFWANAIIDGSDVVASSPEVPDPQMVYYAWAQNPQISLYNTEGLPASPFRTDQPPPPSAK